VHNLYTAKRSELGLDGDGSSEWSRRQETNLTTLLLGKEAPQEDSRNAASSEEQKQPEVSLPLIFRYWNLAAVGLDAGQEEGVKELREAFIEQIGGLGQDPSDPAYYQRWQKAQHWVEEQLLPTLGSQTMMRYRSQEEDLRVQMGFNP
jgi:hypothetical protein